jgi:hypothetical protein
MNMNLFFIQEYFFKKDLSDLIGKKMNLKAHSQSDFRWCLQEFDDKISSLLEDYQDQVLYRI